MTRAAALEFGVPAIVQLHRMLIQKAEQYDGLDCLQVFRDPEHPDRRLWFIEDGGEEPHVTALLPEDY